MHVALVSTCAVAVPPSGYGGTELIIAELAKMLTRLGHDVTVFATGDSHPEAQLRACFDAPVWPPDDLAELRHAAFAWNEIARGGFDVVHAHQAPSLAFASLFTVPTVLTIHHTREPRYTQLYRAFDGVAYVAISRRQAELIPEVPVHAVVHHGLDPSLYRMGNGDGGYCAFLGRLAEEKAPHVAIDAARAAGVRLVVGGAVHWPNEAYFAREVRPRMVAAGGGVDWRGEVGHGAKVELLRHARALLFPIDWEEPFGLVMIEAMLVGTPVIAFARGSVPEIVEEGVTGFVVRDTAEMAMRIRALDRFDRALCRARAEERWSSLRMAGEYERIYAQVAGRAKGRKWPSGVHALDPQGSGVRSA